MPENGGFWAILYGFDGFLGFLVVFGRFVLPEASFFCWWVFIGKFLPIAIVDRMTEG